MLSASEESTHRFPGGLTLYLMQLGKKPDQTSMQHFCACCASGNIFGGGGGVQGESNLGLRPARLRHSDRLNRGHKPTTNRGNARRQALYRQRGAYVISRTRTQVTVPQPRAWPGAGFL